jgi:hypothetical protein
MAERISTGYKRLFEIRLLHHYWLDEGQIVFDLIPDQAKRDARLLKYDMRSFLAVTPTVATTKAFNGFGCVYKDTALGCIVAVPNSAVIPADELFEFVVTVRSAAVWNYTVLTLRLQKIYELYHQPEDKTFRYKENVPVLSNLTGASRGTGLDKALFLSREFPTLAADDDQVESLFLSSGALQQLTGDQPGAGTQQLNAQATNLPVYVHQGDVLALVPPAGLAGVPSRGVMLFGDISDDVFMFVRLSAIRADDGDFSFINGSGHAKTTNPVFQIRLKNRSTIWQYVNKSTGVVKSTEPNPLPSTYFGNAGTKQKPSEGLVKAVKSGTTIIKLVSEIFV